MLFGHSKGRTKVENKLLGTITLEDFPPLSMPQITEQLMVPMLQAINQGMPPQEVAQLPTSHMLSILRTLQVVTQQYALTLQATAAYEAHTKNSPLVYVDKLDVPDTNLIESVTRDYLVFLAEETKKKAESKDEVSMDDILTMMKSTLPAETEGNDQ